MYGATTLICWNELSQVSVVAGKLSLPLVWVFAGLHQLAGGGLLTFNSILQFLHFVLVLGFVGDFCGFLQQPEEHLLEQLLHPCAGVPAQFLFDLSGSAALYSTTPA